VNLHATPCSAIHNNVRRSILSSLRSTWTQLFGAMLLPVLSACASTTEPVVDVQNDEIDVTLFRGAANNTYFPVYFRAQPESGADKVVMETREVDLRPERNVTLHVEIYNPDGTTPLVITPGGNGDPSYK